MARTKKLTYGAINITIHPHTPEKYISLFKMARKIGENIHLRGDSYATLSYFSQLKKGNTDKEPFEGEILKFTDIDINGDWFNISSKDLATDAEKGKISIPENLKPNVGRFPFVFLPVSHLIVYENQDGQKSLSSIQVEKFFNEMFSNERIIKRFGKVNVTILTEPDSVEKMLSLKGITCVNLLTRRPNPDDLVTAEKAMQRRFKKLGVMEEERTLKSERGEEIKPDKELKQEALIAARNGEVNIRRHNESGYVEELSTNNKPLRRVEAYDPDVTSLLDLLVQKAYSLRDEFKKLLASK